MSLKKDAMFRLAKQAVVKRKQAELKDLNRLAMLALMPSDETIENIAHEIVEEVQEAIIEKHSNTQSDKAKKGRSPKNEDAETLDEVIARLKFNHPDEEPRKVWVHLKTAIEEWSESDCKEVENTKRDSWSYQYVL